MAPGVRGIQHTATFCPVAVAEHPAERLCEDPCIGVESHAKGTTDFWECIGAKHVVATLLTSGGTFLMDCMLELFGAVVPSP